MEQGTDAKGFRHLVRAARRDCFDAHFTCRQPSSGANIMNKLATPLRSYS
jgi:hypothetical protein